MIAATGWVVAVAVAWWALRLRSVLEWRMELVARACHELRGPITAAKLGLELVARSAEIKPGALHAIDLELSGAGIALDDLSAAGAGRRGPWRVDAVDVPVLLAESVEALRPLALARGVELDVHWLGEPGIVRADRVRLAQATRNLIANAIEHGEGRIELHGRTDDVRLEIAVTDCGQGLPAPAADLIARARAGRGRRGRGLAIAADIAQRHGGRLVAATDDNGSSYRSSGTRGLERARGRRAASGWEPVMGTLSEQAPAGPAQARPDSTSLGRHHPGDARPRPDISVAGCRAALRHGYSHLAPPTCRQ